MKLSGSLSLMIVAVLLAGCSKDEDYTDKQRVCIGRQYDVYDRKKIDQCIQVCKNCFGGTTTTCSTSCKLNGAN